MSKDGFSVASDDKDLMKVRALNQETEKYLTSASRRS